MKRAMKQQQQQGQQQRGQRESAASETGGSSTADRDSTEFKQAPTFPPADPPERGILKKHGAGGSPAQARRTTRGVQSIPGSGSDAADCQKQEVCEFNLLILLVYK